MASLWTRPLPNQWLGDFGETKAQTILSAVLKLPVLELLEEKLMSILTQKESSCAFYDSLREPIPYDQKTSSIFPHKRGRRFSRSRVRFIDRQARVGRWEKGVRIFPLWMGSGI